MLAKRIIPCLDVKSGRVVKGRQFIDIEDAGDPVAMASFYDNQGADELVFYDITASFEGRNTMIDVVEKTSQTVFIPFTVGGGVNSVEQMRDLLIAGADKISINTAAWKRPELINMAAERFGSQCVVLSIDCLRHKDNADLWWEVVINGGRTKTGADVVDWATEGVNRGAGELVLNSMDADGTKDGYDNELNRRLAETVNVPIIASGGAGCLEHLRDALLIGKADAVLAASIFHFKKFSIYEAKKYLKTEGLAIRI